MPDSGDGVTVVFPKLAFVTCAIGGEGGIFGMFGLKLAVAIEKVGKANFEENIVVFKIFFKFLLILYKSVFEGDAVGTDDVGVGDEIILGVFIANSHGFVPDLLGNRGAGLVETSDNDAENSCDY